MISSPGFGRVSLIALVIASMIGVGVYSTSGFALGALKSPGYVLAAWSVAGMIAVCGAVGYGLLARQITENGGEYLYLSRNVHPIAGVIVGWVSFIAGFSGAGAAAALGFAKYVPVDQWLGFEESRLGSSSVAFVLVVMATLAQCRNHRVGTGVQNSFVMIKLLAIVGFVLLASYLIASAPASIDSAADSVAIESTAMPVDVSKPDDAAEPEDAPEPSLWQAFLTQVMWISFSYTGFNAAIYVAGESRSASDVARSMWQSAVLVTLFYLALNAAFVYSAPLGDLQFQPDIAAVASRALGGPNLEFPVRGMIGLGLATSVFSVLMAGPRVYAKMASEKAFPRWFDDARQPPTRCVLVQGVVMSVLVFASELVGLIESLAIVLSLSAATTVASSFWSASLRTASFRSTGGLELANAAPIVAGAMALVYVLATLILVGVASIQFPERAILAISIVVMGLGWYFLSGRRFSRSLPVDPSPEPPEPPAL
ncbi:MAG: APC family permease [Planctomycetota bacterium]